VEFDTDRILNWGIGYIISIILFIVFRKELPGNYGLYRTLFILGFLLLLGAILYSAISEHRWSTNFLLDVLLIKKVGTAGTRKLMCAAYLLILWSVSLSAIVLMRDTKKKERE